MQTTGEFVVDHARERVDGLRSYGFEQIPGGMKNQTRER